MDKHARDTYLSLRVSVALPLLQALVSGLLLGIAAGAVAHMAGAGAVVATAVTIAALTGAVAWVSGLLWWRGMINNIDAPPARETLPQVEPLLLPEQAAPPSVRIELVRDGGRSGAFIELPAPAGKLYALARGLVDGAPIAEAYWCGGARSVFSRSEFVRLRDEMVRRGLLALNSPHTPARGFALTASGRAVMRHLASSTPPSVIDGDYYER